MLNIINQTVDKFSEDDDDVSYLGDIGLVSLSGEVLQFVTFTGVIFWEVCFVIASKVSCDWAVCAAGARSGQGRNTGPLLPGSHPGQPAARPRVSRKRQPARLNAT